MPAIVYGKAFTVAQDKRLIDLVATIESTSPMPGVYITGVHDVMLWCIRHLSGTPLATAFAAINTAYGSTYDPSQSLARPAGMSDMPELEFGGVTGASGGSQFSCRACGTTTTMVKDSRPSHVNKCHAIRRRRICEKCGERFTTYELSSEDLARLGVRQPAATLDTLNDVEQALRQLRALLVGRDA